MLVTEKNLEPIRSRENTFNNLFRLNLQTNDIIVMDLLTCDINLAKYMVSLHFGMEKVEKSILLIR